MIKRFCKRVTLMAIIFVLGSILSVVLNESILICDIYVIMNILLLFNKGDLFS